MNWHWIIRSKPLVKLRRKSLNSPCNGGLSGISFGTNLRAHRQSFRTLESLRIKGNASLHSITFGTLLTMNYNVTITSKGQLTLPAKVRRALGIDENHHTLSLRFDGQSETVILEKPVSFAEIRGYVQKHAKNKDDVEMENINERYEKYRLAELKRRGVL